MSFCCPSAPRVDLSRVISAISGALALLLLPLLLAPLPALAKTPAYFAGFAFSSNHADIAGAFPHSSALLDQVGDDGRPVLEAALLRKVQATSHPELDIIFDSLGDYESGQALSLAFVLDWENVASEVIDGTTKLVIDLHAQLLVFDFASMRVIGSYPVAVQVRDVAQSGQVEQRAREIIRNLYLGRDGTNIFDQFAKTLASAPVAPSYGNYIGVTQVELGDLALRQLADYGADLDETNAFLARFFRSALSSETGVPMLPYTKGQAIGAKMPARFANGDIYMLDVPAPDYAIHLKLRGFKRVEVDANRVQSLFAYANYVDIRVEQPELGRAYMDNAFKYAVTKRVPRSMTQVDDWSAFQESLLAFTRGFASQVVDTERDWLRQWGGGLEVRGEFEGLRRVVERCR